MWNRAEEVEEEKGKLRTRLSGGERAGKRDSSFAGFFDIRERHFCALPFLLVLLLPGRGKDEKRKKRPTTTLCHCQFPSIPFLPLSDNGHDHHAAKKERPFSLTYPY